MNFLVRKIHKYLSFFISLQLLLWTISGIYFAFNKIELVRGEQYLNHVETSFDLSKLNFKIEKAKEVKSDYVLWLDSDMMFPSTTALRLLAHNKDIVACNYMKRSKPLKTVAYTDLRNWDSWLPLEPKDDLIKVEGVGMGCMLMKTEIFNSLQKPYFEFTYKGDTQDWYGEDFMLLTKLRLNEFNVYIDTILSMDIKHLGIYAFGNND